MSAIITARVRALWILGLLLLFAGCGLVNNPVATYEKIGDRFLIEVTAKRAGWSHDLTRRESYTDRWTFDVPRIDGKIDGKEIRQKQGFYPYVGSITVHGETMVVSLSAENYDSHRLDRVAWNGSYTLVGKMGGAPKAEPEEAKRTW